MIFLSIIIPTYNLSRYLLQRCIKSIKAQNLKESSYEIIIVDDGSERPPLWINELESTNIKLICAPHKGPGAARNTGIEKAKGLYIHFVDGDDTLIPDSLAYCIETLINQQPQILHHKYRICKTEEKANKAHKQKEYKTGYIISGSAYMCKENLSGAPWVYFFKRELAVDNNIRFPEGILHEDEEFNTILHYHAQSLIESNAVIYNYCIREDSTTGNFAEEHIEKCLEGRKTVFKNLLAFQEATKETSGITQQNGLKRKITMLTVDYILTLLHLGKKKEEIIKECNNTLKPLELYPLPQAKYSVKYNIFRLLANNNKGIAILRMIVPSKIPNKK